MTFQTIHEFGDRFDVYVKHLGHGTVFTMTAGSTTTNPHFLVKLQNGHFRTVDQNDMAAYGNPGSGEPLFPEIPKDWLKPGDEKYPNQKSE